MYHPPHLDQTRNRGTGITPGAAGNGNAVATASNAKDDTGTAASERSTEEGMNAEEARDTKGDTGTAA